MSPSGKLFVIKLLHSIIWIFFVTVIFYILYSGIANEISTLTWIAIGLVIGEGIILLIFKMFCPLTIIARKYSDSDSANFDIFLPLEYEIHKTRRHLKGVQNILAGEDVHYKFYHLRLQQNK